MTSIAFNMTSPRDHGNSGALPTRPRGPRDSPFPPPSEHHRCPRRLRLEKDTRLLPPIATATNCETCREVLKLLRCRRPEDTREHDPSGRARTSPRRRHELEAFGFADAAPTQLTGVHACPMGGAHSTATIDLRSSPQRGKLIRTVVPVDADQVPHANFIVTAFEPDLVVVVVCVPAASSPTQPGRTPHTTAPARSSPH
jgi:hypothetical protein